MKSKFTSTLFLFMIIGSLAFQSCQKTETLKVSHPITNGSSSTNAISNDPLNNTISRGGGASGNGHNGGNSGGGSIPSFDPSLATADTTTSPLPVADIITVGRWKVTSFVQGKDNTTREYANYIFTFNSDGTVSVDDQASQTIGFWHYQEAIFYYGIPVYGRSPYGFTLTIPSGLPLVRLNENYFISKKTLTTIFIDSINPNENAHVTFSKLAQ